MKNKIVGVTKSIYDLCKVLEKFEDDECINFIVFYTFSEILESPHYCPGWEFELQYYEIQYDKFDRLQVLQFPFKGNMGDEGHVLTEEQIIELTKNLKEGV